ncbi:N-alpha-acetyltransferase 80 [Daktulosphaira vitifoliae]|uniref:N-alpha-acetyltransferase 80 n=1 Tax=Daktulosphaira vitifoliae TaxID=58002 RepID=UPI0021AA065F|nr:N-alpha-acetyltransferase 80 [Daktulosphaira vitifoliae]
MDQFAVVQLHRNKHFIKSCCAVINSEWPRSESARLHSLEASCDTLPTSLILTKKTEDIEQAVVVGHSKVTPIPSMPESCFVESVVIKHEHRRKGLGKFLMLKTEEFIKTLGIHTVYLSTLDKQEFYSKLGYIQCLPINIYGNFSKMHSSLTMNFPSRKVYMKKILL